MKRVKLQERQHTFICNDEELHQLIDAIEFYATKHPTEEDKNRQESYFLGDNPCLDMFAEIYTVFNNVVGNVNEDCRNLYNWNG